MVAQMNLKKFWDAQYWSAFVTQCDKHHSVFSKVARTLAKATFKSLPINSSLFVGHGVQS